MPKAWIGTSGYKYKHWIGPFYPPELPHKEHFAYYAQHLDAVELNVTFYGLPKREAFEAWAAAAPDDFKFVLKGSRYITHMKRLTEPEEPVDRFFERVEPLGDKLAAVLWQLPPRSKAVPDRLDAFLAAVGRNPRGAAVRHAFEFRDRSWFTPAVYDVLAAHGAVVVLADWPFQVLGPGMHARRLKREAVRVPHTAGWVYLRRHGPGDPFGSGYSRSQIQSDARYVRGWLAEDKDVFAFYKKEAFDEADHEVFAFYNNDAGGYGVRDALGLARAVKG
jgi:uncharacterized protein YecE (DUF72 family)